MHGSRNQRSGSVRTAVSRAGRRGKRRRPLVPVLVAGGAVLLAAVCGASAPPVGAAPLRSTAAPASSPPVVEAAAPRDADAVTGLSFASLAGGTGQTCGQVDDGTVRCWGWNFYGQLGDGTTADSSIPLALPGITTAVSVAAGGRHTCAVLADGTVRCWGANDFGQLGDGTNQASVGPVTVTGITTAVAVVAGAYHSCAMLQDQTVRCWGYNYFGQLGDGSTQTSYVPVAVSGLSGAVELSNGWYHSCARLDDHTLRCWGQNDDGQVGARTPTPQVPAAVTGITTAVALAAGGLRTCAVLADHTARCWGSNAYGGLGNGGTQSSVDPVVVSGLTTAVAVSSGQYHSCVVLESHTMRCWGLNSNGQLGNGTTFDASTPVPVSGITTAVGVTLGGATSHAQLDDGTTWSWGLNGRGQLGDGTFLRSLVPVPMLPLLAARDLQIDALTGDPATGTVVVDGAGARTLTYAVVSGPSSGSVVGSGPEFTYVPDVPDVAVDDTFVYRATASDGMADTGTVTVHLTVPDAPDAPAPVTTVGRTTQLTVSWTTPVSDGGAPVTDYVVSVTPVGGADPVVQHVAPPTLSTVVAGLAVGDHVVSVVAVNRAGPGPAAVATGHVPAADEISGRVVDQLDAAPLSGIRVRLFTPAGVLAGQRFSDASGAWSFSGLRLGDYTVQFADVAEHRYYLEYWPDASFRPEATPVSTGTADVVGELDRVPVPPPTGALTGLAVDDASGDPLPGIRVRAFTSAQVLAGAAYTGADGTWVLPALPVGDYVVQFADDLAHAYELEYWQDAELVGGATLVHTDSPSFTARLHAVPVLSLSGTVVDTTTLVPVAGIRVRAFTPAGVLVATAWTTIDGSWAISGLAAGSYALQFADPTNGAYPIEYWENARLLADATPVAAGTAGLDVRLGTEPPPASPIDVDGHVHDATGTGISGIRVRAYTMTLEFAGESYSVGPLGYWSLGGLPPGTYYLQFADKTNQVYLLEYWQDARTTATATPVPTGTRDLVVELSQIP